MTPWAIAHGDCLRLLELYDGEPFDALICDPPYSSGGAMRSDRNASTITKYIQSDSGNRDILRDFEGDNRDGRSFLVWCALWLQAARMKCKPGAIGIVFCDWRQLPTMTDAVQAGGWVWRAIIPWNKTEATRPQLGRPRAQCEYCIFVTNGPHQAYEGAPCLPGFYECPAPRERIHITEKPVDLLRDLCTLAPPDGLVLDPFVGSGSTAIGALSSGRRFYGMELSRAICDEARARVHAFTQGLSLDQFEAGQQPMFAKEIA